MKFKEFMGLLAAFSGVAVILMFIAYFTTDDKSIKYPEGKRTVEVTNWYDTDSSLHGCKIYYMHGDEGDLKIKIGESKIAPVDLYVMNCNGVVSLTSVKTIEKKK